ncbi:MAG: dynamin family protein [Pseudomonadota bacterium]
MGILDRIAGRFDELVGGTGDPPADDMDPLAEARAHAQRGDHEAAAAAFGRFADADVASGGAWLGLAESLAHLGRFEPARDAYRRALASSLPPHDQPRARAGLGRLYARALQWGKAVRELRRAAEALPDDAAVLADLGRALIAAGEGEGADWLARAARLPGGDPAFLIEAAAAKSDATAALRLLREAVARTPYDAGVRAALARHLMVIAAGAAAPLADGSGAGVGAGDEPFAEALAEARAAVAAAPDDSRAWRILREVHAAAGDYRAARAAADRESAAGAAPAFDVALSLALGVEDSAAVAEVLARHTPDEVGFAEAGALVTGALDGAGIALLARLAPSPGARRFVIRALAPPPPPADNLYALLVWAEGLAARHTVLLPLAVPMARAVEAFDRPLLVAVMGEFNAGKSSLVNALAGQAIAPVGVTPTTATINILRHGTGGGRAVYHDGRARDLRAEGVAGFLNGLDDADAAAIRHVEIFAPIEALRRVEIVDTPGLNSLRAAHEKVARDFLLEADAIVWVFAAGQAAKATEREALALAHAAGKRVLGVINKVDRASADEIAAVVRHVETELRDLVERVVPLSARAALEARARDDRPALEASGLPVVEAALESTFFARARELKRETALAALRRFVAEARAAAGPTPTTTAAETAGATPADVAAAEQELRSAIAAERVGLRARLEEALRAAAFEVREFVRPRAWLFGEHSADPDDETFLRDVLDDGVIAATARTRAVLRAAVPAGPLVATSHAADLFAAVDAAVDGFRAYARGVLEGAAAVFFRIDLPRIRLDLAAIRNALGRWSPDPEEVLFRPVERAVAAFLARTRADLDARARAGEIAELMRREHLLAPLDALGSALEALAAAPAATETAATPIASEPSA